MTLNIESDFSLNAPVLTEFIAYDAQIVTDGLGNSYIRYTDQIVEEAITAPVLADTLTLSGRIEQSFSRTLSIQSGSPATSWDIVGGADQGQYTLSDAGALVRTVDQDLVESEVIEVTATNSAGTSNTQTITINYIEDTGRTKSRRSRKIRNKTYWLNGLLKPKNYGG